MTTRTTTPPKAVPAPDVRRVLGGPVVLVAVVALVVALVTATASGALTPLLLGDTGPVVRYGQIIARVLHDVSAALTIGLLFVAGFLTPEGRHTTRRSTAAVAAAYCALAWLLSATLGVFFTFSSSSALMLSDPAFWGEFVANAWALEITRLILIEMVIVALVCVMAALGRTREQLAWAGVLALATLWPISFAGHGSSLVGHEQGATSLLFHLVGVTLWVGGLLAIVILRPVLGSAVQIILERYSKVALACYFAVGGSGVLFALLQADNLADLVTPYWLVLWLKVLALIVLGAFGYHQRRQLLLRDTTQPRVFARIAITELGVMATAIGLGVALARTPPPVIQDLTGADPALGISGFPTPDPFTWGKLVTAWEPMWLFLIPAVLAIALYLAGASRLHRRGDAWPVSRSIVWVAGWLVFIYATSGAPGMYGKVQFSLHMVMHMLLMMAVPILLVPASPITLALRALKPRTDKTLGPREVVLAIAHSKWAGFFVQPLVAAVLFFGSLIAFYYTGWFEWSLRTHTGHVVMVVHFVATGYAFVWSLVGTDPGPRKWPAPLRLMVLIGTLAAHAFFGLALMSGNWLLAPSVFKTLNLSWVPDLLADQRLAGGIAWGIGELPTVVLALLVTLDWLRSDTRDAVRQDRQADRDHDAELAAYNEQLAALSRRGSDPRPH